MVDGRGIRVVRAMVIVAAALVTTSVVLWPVALVSLPLLFWAATGGRVARWTAACVATTAVLLAAQTAVWASNGGSRGSGAATGWSAVALALVVGAPTLVAFVGASSRLHAHREGAGAKVAPAPS